MATTLVIAAAPVRLPSGPAFPPGRHGFGGTPPIRAILQQDEDCTKPSTTVAEAKPWTRSALGLTRSWRLSRGAGVLVAVVDTGVDGSTPAPADQVDAVGAASKDCVGHGSFAAGLIAAAPQPGTGVVGIAPAARVLSVSLDARDALTEAVAYATEHDALVVAPAAPDIAPSESGSSRPDPTAWPYFLAFIPQVLFVADYGPQGGRPEGAPQPFAPDLAAPGDSVVSVGPGGEGHFIGSGSSLAAANVAGAAALVRARSPELSAGQTVDRLEHSAYPSDVPRLDLYVALSSVGGADRATAPRGASAQVELPEPHSQVPRTRAVAIAASAGIFLAPLVAAMVVVPRGRARSWRSAGR
ncbi:S8 family serine peptidase [Streptomyces sp. NPDC005065]|uniref:S8 family serine peptidase n=1 Tax=Streptomyces sp. NPDC005065 TaxID=3154461 RepID=UPI0033A81CE7